MPNIQLNLLEAHPANANVMPEALLGKLTAHIERSGRYPPLIVRPHPERADRYQILDGHHRAEALRRLGLDLARCELWDVDDHQARVLLLTLNRLQGSDDPLRRGALLKRLADELGDVKALAASVPEDAARIDRLIALTDPPPRPAPPRPVDSIPQAVTFFLAADQRRALFAQLDAIARDRSEALVALLELDRHHRGAPGGGN